MASGYWPLREVWSAAGDSPPCDLLSHLVLMLQVQGDLRAQELPSILMKLLSQSDGHRPLVA